jgi:8-oxo-dGTP pyrophosphatase MutT (NUDIX family)
MLQRALCDDDTAAGKLEFPGGHLDNGESPLAGAMREWQEETGLMFPAGEVTGSWTSLDGVYRGVVYTIPREADIVLDDRVNDRVGR